jgi:hypothetical protein
MADVTSIVIVHHNFKYVRVNSDNSHTTDTYHWVPNFAVLLVKPTKDYCLESVVCTIVWMNTGLVYFTAK